MRKVYWDELGNVVGTCHVKPTTFSALGVAAIWDATTYGSDKTFLFSSKMVMMASTVAFSNIHWMYRISPPFHAAPTVGCKNAR